MNSKLKKKVKLKTFIKELVDFNQYRVIKKSQLKIDLEYDVFYFIFFAGKLYKARHSVLNEKNKQEFFKHDAIPVFLYEKEKQFFSKYSVLDTKIILYAIPRVKKCKNDFSDLHKIFYRLTQLSDIDKFRSFFSKNSKYLPYIFATYLYIYSAYLYLALKSIGIPIQLVLDVNTVLTVVGFFFVILIMTVSFVPFLFLIFVLLIMDFPEETKFYGSLVVIFVLGLYTIYRLCNRVYYFIRPIEIKDFVMGMYYPAVMIILAVISIITIVPFIYVIDSFRQHNSFPEHGQPTFLLESYYDLTGFPKVGELHGKKYIVVGYDTVHYYAYQSNKILEYLDIEEKSGNFEQMCRNMEGEYKDQYKLIFEALRHSKNNNPSQAELFKNKGSDIKFQPLNLNTLTIDKLELEQKCTKYLRKINKEKSKRG